MTAVKYVKFLYTFMIYSITNFEFVSGGDVTAKNTSVPFVEVNTSVVLVWKVTVGTDQKVSNIRLFIVPNFTNPVMTGLVPTITRKWEHLYGKRLSATFNEARENNFIMTFKEIQYYENFTFRLRADFEKGLEPDGRSVADIHIKNVYGSPSFCGNNQIARYTTNESDNLRVVQNICGHPKPDVKWKLGQDNFKSSTSSTKINDAIRLYEYTFTTRPVTRKDCGRILTCVTSHTLGSIKRTAKVDIKFVPSLVSKVSLYRISASCVRVAWDREDTGKCNISYHLQFPGTEAIYNTSNTYFTLCNSSDVDTVIIWASYKGNIGGKLGSRIIATTLSPGITSTPNIATTDAGKSVPTTCRLNCYITVSISRKRPPQSYENRSTDDYEETSATVSHYADIDTKAAKPSIYADLTSTADQSKHYAEIELNKKQQNTYANMKD